MHVVSESCHPFVLDVSSGTHRLTNKPLYNLTKVSFEGVFYPGGHNLYISIRLCQVMHAVLDASSCCFGKEVFGYTICLWVGILESGLWAIGVSGKMQFIRFTTTLAESVERIYPTFSAMPLLPIASPNSHIGIITVLFNLYPSIFEKEKPFTW